MQGEIYRTIKATQMCAPFQREEMGGRRRRSVREEGCMRSGGGSTQAGIGLGESVLGHAAGTCGGFHVYGELRA